MTSLPLSMDRNREDGLATFLEEVEFDLGQDFYR
jgi:hypothetical protein